MKRGQYIRQGGKQDILDRSAAAVLKTALPCKACGPGFENGPGLVFVS